MEGSDYENISKQFPLLTHKYDSYEQLTIVIKYLKTLEICRRRVELCLRHALRVIGRCFLCEDLESTASIHISALSIVIEKVPLTYTNTYNTLYTVNTDHAIDHIHMNIDAIEPNIFYARKHDAMERNTYIYT